MEQTDAMINQRGKERTPGVSGRLCSTNIYATGAKFFYSPRRALHAQMCANDSSLSIVFNEPYVP